MSLTPDYMFHTYDEITPQFLKRIGVSAVLSDIDNTLAPYEMPEPDEKILAWAKSLADNGIKLALISNNSPERVEKFNGKLGLPAYPDSHKPGVKILKKALKELGADPEKHNVAVVGDQLLTDVAAARRLGAKAIIVPPIKDKKTLFFRFKRALEKPIIKKYLKARGFEKAEE